MSSDVGPLTHLPYIHPVGGDLTQHCLLGHRTGLLEQFAQPQRLYFLRLDARLVAQNPAHCCPGATFCLAPCTARSTAE